MRFSWRLGWAILGGAWLAGGTSPEARAQWTEVIGKGPNFAVIKQLRVEREASGTKRMWTNSWFHLEDGLHYWDPAAGDWVESVEEIVISGKGAEALRGQHQASFSPNANDPEGAVDLRVRGVLQIRSSVLALRYYDPSKGATALLGTVQDARGELLKPNQIIYRNVFDDVRADLVYTYRKSGLEADVVLREIPPPPQELGLDPEATRIEVVTEFFEPPEPVRTHRTASAGRSRERQSRGEGETWIDEDLHFGESRIGEGRAFAWSAREVAERKPHEFAPVVKRWVRTEDQRTLLVESVDYHALLDELVELPAPEARVRSVRELRALWAARGAEARNVSRTRFESLQAEQGSFVPAASIPKRPVTLAAAIRGGIAVARSSIAREPGLVLDWNLVNVGATNFTFASTNTYLVSGHCLFEGTTRIEGGTVVKFPDADATPSSLTVGGPIVFATSAYRPAVFTAESDNSVGETVVPGGPRVDTDYGSVQLRLLPASIPVAIQHVRMKHARSALHLEGNHPGNRIRHAQFVDCRFSVSSAGPASVVMENALIDGSGKEGGVAFSGTNNRWSGTHLTVHQVRALSRGATLALTNSIVAEVDSVGGYSGVGNWEAPVADGLFQPTGAGGFYLREPSPVRGRGISEIPAALRAELAELTTDAPLALPVSSDREQVFAPRARRNRDRPDLGYHYSPVDYVANNRSVQHATLRFVGGVVVATYGLRGFTLGPGARLESQGTAAAPNRFVAYSQVQEQTTSPWLNTTGDLALLELARSFGDDLPRVDWQFTEAVLTSGPGHRRLWIREPEAWGFEIAVRHSRLTGVALNLESAWPDTVLDFTNCLFVDSDLRVLERSDHDGSPLDVRWFNLTFHRGQVRLESERREPSWVIRDTLFDSHDLVTTGVSGDISHNAFRNGLPEFGTNSVGGLVTSFRGSLIGNHTYPTPGSDDGDLSRLIDAGSRSASDAGLHGFATQSNGQAEENSRVDIGFHYPALVRPEGGLAGYWKLDQNLGTMAPDDSGLGQTGILLNGPVWTAGQSGGALRFDGLNDLVSIADGPGLRFAGPFTVGFWIRKDAESTDWVRWIGKGDSAARNFGVFGWERGDGRILFQFQTQAGGISTLGSVASLRLGRWYHVACTWDGAAGRIYVDGRLDAEGNMPGPPVTSVHPVTLGNAGFHGVLAGAMDEVCLFRRALTAEEVVRIAERGANDDSVAGPLGHWALDESSGTVARDSGRAGRDGRVASDRGWVPGVLGNALAFDGTGAGVTIPDTPVHRVQGPFSVALWLRKNSERTDWVRLVGKGGLVNRNFGIFDFPGESGQILFQFSVLGGGYSVLTSRSSLALHTWHHVACVWDGNTGRIYLDGALDAEGPMPGPIVSASDPLTFGYAGYHDVLDGALDEVCLFDRALSAHDVRALARFVVPDSDGDGLPDLVEDTNGNGYRDGTETDIWLADSDSDGRSDGQERADGTDPVLPGSVEPRRLGLWNFDNPSDPWRGDNGSEPVERTGVGFVELESFVYGAELNATGAALRFREREADGRANISLLQGTIRLHYFPYWISAFPACGLDVAGIGPGAPIELLSVGDFSIQIDSKGTNLLFRTPDGTGGWITNAQAGFKACVGDFPPDFPMDIQVSYSTNGSALFLNGERLARGPGVRALPSSADRARGVFVGTSPDRKSPARGVVDAVFTYNVPLQLSTNATLLNLVVAQSPPSVTLNWVGVTNGFYRIERRSLPDTTWQFLASANPPSYTDANVVAGRSYEYRLTVDEPVPPELFASTDPAPLTVVSGVDLPADDLPGHVLLIVDRTLLEDLAFAEAVDGLTRDLWAEGWVVGRYAGPRHDDASPSRNASAIAEIKAWIREYRSIHPGGSGAVYLLGHLPIPFSGMLSPDGHPYRPLPTDAYYGDLDGRWTDSADWPLAPGIAAPNRTGDGVFDQELVPPNADGLAEVELAVGRVDFANLPAFSSASASRSEIDLLVQYIAKTRRYRRAEILLPEKAMATAYFSTNTAGEAKDHLRAGLLKLGARLQSSVHPETRASEVGNFFDAGIPATWGILGGFAGGHHLLNSRGPVNAYYGIGPHQTRDLVTESGEPPVAFTLLEGSWMAEWHGTNHLGRALLAGRQHGYGWSYAGASRIEWQYPAMSLGMTLGEAWRKTLNDAWMWPLASVLYQSRYGTGVRVNLGDRSQGGYLYASLLGDPTLRQSPPTPPASVMVFDHEDGTFSLVWAPPSRLGVTYHVYRSIGGVGSRWTRLTQTPTPYRWYTETDPPEASPVYMIRALIPKTVASGTSMQVSAGSFWP